MEALYSSLKLLDCCKKKEGQKLIKSSFKSHPTSSMAKIEENDFIGAAAWKSENYPLNSVVIFGGKQKIIAKRTKKVVFDYNVKHPKNYILGSRKLATFIKSLTSVDSFESIEPQSRSFNKLLPENIAVCVANRLKCRVMVDAICGSGENTVQFAKYCDEVIAICGNREDTMKAKEQAEKYQDGDKIDFITADFLTLRRLTANLVFLNPVDIRSPNSTRKCSIAKDLKPELEPILVKSLEISRSIALKVPKDIDFEELVQLFHSSLEKYGGYSKRYCIEIQEIVDDVNGNFGCYMVYFGKCSSIKRVEEYKAVYDYFAKKEDESWKSVYPFHVIAAIVEKIGLYRTLKYIAEVEEYEALFGRADPFFDSFKIKLIDENMFSREKLEQIIEEEQKKPLSPNLMKKFFRKQKATFIKPPELETYSKPKIASIVTAPEIKPEKALMPAKTMNQKPEAEKPKEIPSPSINGFIRRDSKEFDDLSDTSYSLSIDLFQFSQKEGSSFDGSFAMTETYEEFKQSNKDKDRSLNNLNTKNESLAFLLYNKERTNTAQFNKKFTESVLSHEDAYKHSQSISPTRPIKIKKSFKPPVQRKMVLLSGEEDTGDCGFFMKEG